MTPSHTAKGSRRYRYYVSQAVLQGKPAGTIRRIAAHPIEVLVLAALRAIPVSSSASTPASATIDHVSDAELIARCLRRVTVHPDVLQIDLLGADDHQPIRIAWAPKRSHNRRDIIVPPGSNPTGLRPMKVEDRSRILEAIARSRAWVEDLEIGRAHV